MKKPYKNAELTNQALRDNYRNLSPEQTKKLAELASKEQYELIIQQQRSLSYSGPIPTPESMEKYDNVIPDGANRIMTMAEKAQNSKIHKQNEEIKSFKRGQYLGFTFGIFLVISALTLTVLGHEYIGSTMILIIISVLIIFVLGKIPETKPNKSKKQPDTKADNQEDQEK